jgi:hypothetical protein
VLRRTKKWKVEEARWKIGVEGRLKEEGWGERER